MNKLNQVSLIAASGFILTACDLDSDLKIDQDYQHIRVYQDDQQLSCQPDTAISLAQSALSLAQENIEIHCSQKAHDGFAYPESCGSDTGSINVFTIHKGDLATAESLGFAPLNTLPQAQFNPNCEYQVIPDDYKYALIHQVKANINTWESLSATDYQFNYQQSFTDCPSLVASPKVRITVSDDAIVEVYDLDNQTYLNNLTDYSTIPELLNQFKLQLWMTPLYAGRTAEQNYQLAEYDENGVPLNYFYDQGTNECDAVSVNVSDFINLASD
ncbi:DUF6174 domain-containing protein [Catenovulum sp. 2E275]|uniref:DUF6174 domain-containing protein n=1 Tax=Catenovulum sp. 2E275 TaxID=2980497 RepID=UPI0021D219E2|nr:DUF6174 domain-containing protein [Catenovulum sp. 2E275]MCU4675818.1 DUF6174 domain-containing protein [Catenovulum sp. 2E275]